MRTLLIAIGCALALAACGGAASPGQPAPAQIQQTQVTPVPQATPASSSTPRGYDDGY